MSPAKIITTFDSVPNGARPLLFLRESFSSLWRSRELAWGLFLRDLRAQYRQAFLGYVWIVLPPLASMLAWWFVQSQEVLRIAETSVPYPIFALAGLVFWDTFTQALAFPLQQLQAALPMMAKIRFAHEAIGLAAFLQVTLNGLLRLLLFAVVAGVMGWPISPAMLLAVIPMILLVLLGLSTGLVLATAGLLYEDLARSLPMLSGLWFVLTPVVYPLSPSARLIWLNPVSPILQTGRDWMLAQPATHGIACLVVSTGLIVVLLVAWLSFRSAVPHVIARAGA